jgi:hypothetical protein
LVSRYRSGSPGVIRGQLLEAVEHLNGRDLRNPHINASPFGGRPNSKQSVGVSTTVGTVLNPLEMIEHGIVKSHREPFGLRQWSH